MNSFDAYIASALDKGHKELAKRLKQEKRMASALVTALLDKDYVISVNDGEAWCLVRSKKYRAVMDALASTDADVLLVRDAAGEKVGRFYLVYGNSGEELVADYSANDACDAIWNELERVRDQLAY